MKIGVPRELKIHEYRVAITPAGVLELIDAGIDAISYETVWCEAQ